MIKLTEWISLTDLQTPRVARSPLGPQTSRWVPQGIFWGRFTRRWDHHRASSRHKQRSQPVRSELWCIQKDLAGKVNWTMRRKNTISLNVNNITTRNLTRILWLYYRKESMKFSYPKYTLSIHTTLKVTQCFVQHKNAYKTEREWRYE